MTRVALVINELGFGGAEQVVVVLANMLPQYGFQTSVVCLQHSRQLGETIAEAEVHGLGFGAADPRVLGALVDWLRHHPVALAHLHLPRAGVIGRLAALRVRLRPVLYTEHNAWSGYGLMIRSLNRATLGWNDHVVAVSDFVRQYLLSHGVSPDRVTTIRNGVDVMQIRSRAAAGRSVRELAGVPPDTAVVGTVANLHPRKGLDVMIKALARLRYGRHRVVGAIVGRDDGDGSRLRKLAQSLGVAERLFFLGAQPDAPALMSQFDIFVLPSSVEGLPIALLEAMALRRPVVVTDVGGMPEIVHDRLTGRRVAPGDAEGLARILHELLDAPEQARRIGDEAAKFIERDCSADSMVRSYAALYETLLDSERRRDGWTRRSS